MRPADLDGVHVGEPRDCCRTSSTNERVNHDRRGRLKDFEWAGYGIHITVPGRDHLHLAEFDIGMHQTKKTPVKGFVTEAEMGDRIRGWMEEGLGA
jgi:hypothetical protein